ncbi:import component protein [Sphingobacterium haloxyli]|uniref:Import component protein n=1 Tax=Sphingobacterium haloxyli TaxID=2100533 RepID=A0A2S9IY76_9SPHI|nr:import component protein [Sphingobacterium haloxyli]PRD45479.1 import component protein [Sphingobacterium haloxyli]
MTPKVQSILSYLGILWLIAYFGGKQERNDLSKYHLKQGLGLWIIAVIFNIVIYIVVMVVPSLAAILSAVSIIFLILMIFGIINAANEVKKPLPVIGKMFEDKFNFIG